MQTLELTATVENGVVHLPDLPTTPPDGVVKVTLTWEEAPKRNYDPEKLLAALKKLQEMNPFRDIEDPVEWQRKQRDEWE